MSGGALACNISAEDLLTATAQLPRAAAVCWPSLTVSFSSHLSSNGVISVAFELSGFVVGGHRRWYWAPVGATCRPGLQRDRPTLKFDALRWRAPVLGQSTFWTRRDGD